MKKIDIERMSSDPAYLKAQKRNSTIQMFWAINALLSLILASFLIFSFQKAISILVVSSLLLVPMAFISQFIVNQSITNPLDMLKKFLSMYKQGFKCLLQKE